MWPDNGQKRRKHDSRFLEKAQNSPRRSVIRDLLDLCSAGVVLPDSADSDDQFLSQPFEHAMAFFLLNY